MQKKLVKLLLVFVIGVFGLSLSAQTNAKSYHYRGVRLNKAEKRPTSPVAKKGQKIFVVIKDTKKQTVPVVTSRNKRTKRTVKMGTVWKVRNSKRVRKTRIYQIKGHNRWLRSSDVVKY